ncbi:hypothetical protein PsorP6_001121 [Peronosclerospora sorghi]|uniref:Uncharacterized protein n=1 Tax=Peronosclerospora sorghi TaxID=230839 RepID=A0ACC0WQX3_9STRA|nr:hypothetical protein PsorP6_001121 [Peronosclerospora sorghi]
MRLDAVEYTRKGNPRPSTISTVCGWCVKRSETLFSLSVAVFFHGDPTRWLIWNHGRIASRTGASVWQRANDPANVPEGLDPFNLDELAVALDDVEDILK